MLSLRLSRYLSHREQGWIAVKYFPNETYGSCYKLSSPDRVTETALLVVLYPQLRGAPAPEVKKANAKNGVPGLRTRISHEEQLIFFAPERSEFSYRAPGSSGRSPVILEDSHYFTASIALSTICLISESMFSVNGPGRKNFWASPPS